MIKNNKLQDESSSNSPLGVGGSLSISIERAMLTSEGNRNLEICTEIQG